MTLDGSARNHFGDPSMYVGFWGGFNIHHGALQFDLSPIPSTATVTDAALSLTGASARFLGTSGSWHLRLLDPTLDSGWTTRTYSDIHNAATVADVPPVLIPSDLGADAVNTFTFDEDARSALQARLSSTARASFRLDGPDFGPNNLFTWHTGCGSSPAGKRPVLTITYSSP